MAQQSSAVKCINEGTMDNDARDAVFRAMTFCNAHNAVSCRKISDRLRELGYPNIIVQQKSGWAFSNIGNTKYSIWKIENKKFSVAILVDKSAPTDKPFSIKCTTPGNMTNNERNHVLQAIRYCHDHNKMSCRDLKTRLKELGYPKNICVKNQDGWDFIGLGSYHYSVWKAGGYKFGVAIFS